MSELVTRKYTVRHRLISFLRDRDIRGFRRLSVLLPKWLLPSPQKAGKYILTTPGNIKLIIDPSTDHGVELSLHETGTYEKGILHFIQENFKEKGVFVDVGANIGLLSIYVANSFPKSRVVAFEAHPETNQILLENIRLNKLANIDVRAIAVGRERSAIKIYNNDDYNRGGASILVYDANSIGHEVPMNTLDDELKELIVEMIKIDVEGFEFQVLLGAREIILKNKPTLIIEISEERSIESNTNEILRFIDDVGFYKMYKLKGTKERKSRLIEITDRSMLPNHDNIICIPT